MADIPMSGLARDYNGNLYEVHVYWESSDNIELNEFSSGDGDEYALSMQAARGSC